MCRGGAHALVDGEEAPDPFPLQRREASDQLLVGARNVQVELGEQRVEVVVIWRREGLLERETVSVPHK